MFLLRRTAVKALAAPASSFFLKSKATSFAPRAILRVQRQLALPSVQQRLYSVETKGEEQPSTSAADELSSSTPIESNPAPEATENTSTFDRLEQAAASNTSPGHVPSSDKVVYVGNLFFEVTEEQLHKLFSPFGAIEQVKLVCDNRGLSRGFGFIHFQNANDASAAIGSLSQQTFEGRRMIVQVHQARERNTNFTKPLVANSPSKTLFIGNMSFEMSDKDLNDLFRGIHHVLDVRVAIDRRTGQPRGFAHADFVDVESAVRAKEALDNKVVYGRGLRVDFSQSAKHRRSDDDQQFTSRTD